MRMIGKACTSTPVLPPVPAARTGTLMVFQADEMPLFPHTGQNPVASLSPPVLVAQDAATRRLLAPGVPGGQELSPLCQKRRKTVIPLPPIARRVEQDRRTLISLPPIAEPAEPSDPVLPSPTAARRTMTCALKTRIAHSAQMTTSQTTSTTNSMRNSKSSGKITARWSLGARARAHHQLLRPFTQIRRSGRLSALQDSQASFREEAPVPSRGSQGGKGERPILFSAARPPTARGRWWGLERQHRDRHTRRYQRPVLAPFKQKQ